MRYIKVKIETGFHTGADDAIVEVDDDATEEDMEEAARDEFFNQCSYGWVECDEAGNETNT